MWSFFWFLLLPVELRGLVGAAAEAEAGPGRVLLPWLLKPEVAVEEAEKPPLSRAERRGAPDTSKAAQRRQGASGTRLSRTDGGVRGRRRRRG